MAHLFLKYDMADLTRPQWHIFTSHGIVGRWSASSPAMKSSRSCWAVDRSTWIERRDYALLLTMLRDLPVAIVTGLA